MGNKWIFKPKMYSIQGAEAQIEFSGISLPTTENNLLLCYER